MVHWSWNELNDLSCSSNKIFPLGQLHLLCPACIWWDLLSKLAHINEDIYLLEVELQASVLDLLTVDCSHCFKILND